MVRWKTGRSDGGRRIAFGDFVFDLDSHELWRRGQSVALSPKPGAILAALLERPGELVSRDGLYTAGWGNTVVSLDVALNTAIRHIRKALGDDVASPTFVQTVPRRGYRFVGRVTPVVSGSLRSPASALGPHWPRRRAAVSAAAALLALVALTWLPFGPPSRIQVEPLLVESSQLDVATGIPPGGPDPERGRQNEAEEGWPCWPLRRWARRRRLIRTSWSEAGSGLPPKARRWSRSRSSAPRTGRFSGPGRSTPHCPRVSDPVGFIAKYVAGMVVPLTT